MNIHMYQLTSFASLTNIKKYLGVFLRNKKPAFFADSLESRSSSIGPRSSTKVSVAELQILLSPGPAGTPKEFSTSSNPTGRACTPETPIDEWSRTTPCPGQSNYIKIIYDF